MVLGLQKACTTRVEEESRATRASIRELRLMVLSACIKRLHAR